MDIWISEKSVPFVAYLFKLLLSAWAVQHHHKVSFRNISPIFLCFPRPGLCQSDFLVITHLPSQMSQHAARANGLQVTSPLLWTPLLTCIDNDCHWNESIKAASLTVLQTILIVGWLPSSTVHYASLIANHPTDACHVHYGTDGFQARVGCHSQVSFGADIFSRIHR